MRRNGWLLTGVAAATALAMGSPLVVHAQSGITAAQAETIAQRTIGAGAQAYHVSADHQGSAAVWDVHVRNAAGTAYDVKVSVANGTVVSNRPAGDSNAAADHGGGTTTPTSGAGTTQGSSPSPASSGIGAAQAETIAQQAIGAGAQAYHVSADHQGSTAVWDVHVRDAAGTAYDVKVGAANGAVLSKRLAGDSKAAADHAGGSKDTPASYAGSVDGKEAPESAKTPHTGVFLGTTVNLGVKLAQPPAPLVQDTAAAQAALAARMGGPKPLKWIQLKQKKAGWLLTVKVRGGKDKVWLASTGAVVRSKVQVS